MLEWTWFSLLTLAGIGSALKAVAIERDSATDHDDAREMQFQIGAICLLILALVAGSDATVMPVYRWLVSVLPEHGSAINKVTAAAVTGAACLVFLVVIPLATTMAEYRRRDASTAAKVAGNAIERAKRSRT